MNQMDTISKDERDFLNQIKNYKQKQGEESFSIKIMKTILLGGYTASCLVAPGLSHIEKLFMLNDERYCRRIYKSVRRLRDNGFIREVNGKYFVTNKGHIYLQEEKIKDFKILKEYKVKKGLFIIFFDIPEEKRKSRNVLRKILVKNKYKKIQHSIYGSNYYSEKSIQRLVRILDIHGDVATGVISRE